MLTPSRNIANHKFLQALNQTWQPFLKHYCVAILISFLIWLANTELAILVASHGVDVPRGAQHDGVRHTARNLIDDCIKATNFGHHGHGRNRLAAFVILCSGSEVADAQLAVLVVAPDIDLVVLNRAHELLAQSLLTWMASRCPLHLWVL